MTKLINSLAFTAGTIAIAAAAPAAAQSYAYPYGAYNSNPYGQSYAQPNGTYYGQYPSSQYAYPYGYNSNTYNGYGYNRYPYNGYGYNQTYNRNYSRTAYAEQACTSAVQQRLQTRAGLPATVERLILGGSAPRITSITSAKVADNGRIRVKGFASSNSAGSFGSALYGALGQSQQPDLRFRCVVHPDGQVARVDIQKR